MVGVRGTRSELGVWAQNGSIPCCHPRRDGGNRIVLYHTLSQGARFSSGTSQPSSLGRLREPACLSRGARSTGHGWAWSDRACDRGGTPGGGVRDSAYLCWLCGVIKYGTARFDCAWTLEVRESGERPRSLPGELLRAPCSAGGIDILAI